MGVDWMQAFAKTDTTRLFLDEAKKFWIDVRNELGNAEARTIQLASIRGVSRTSAGADNNLVELDLGAGADRKALTYLVDWNLVDQDGKTIDISTDQKKQDAVRHLTSEHYKALEAAIDAHVSARAEEKKLQNGVPRLDPISS